MPLYDAFDAGGAETTTPYDAITPKMNLTERNTNATPNSGFSQRLPLDTPDRVPQRYLDKILWQYVHGKQLEAAAARPERERRGRGGVRAGGSARAPGG